MTIVLPSVSLPGCLTTRNWKVWDAEHPWQKKLKAFKGEDPEDYDKELAKLFPKVSASHMKPVPLEQITTTLHPSDVKAPKAVDRSAEYMGRDLHAEHVWPAQNHSSRYGVVTFDNQGRVLLREPTNHFDGYHWTFPKGHPDKGEHPLESAKRENLEETGHNPAIVGAIPGGFSGSSTGSMQHFYLAHDQTGVVDGTAMSDNGETAHLKWADPMEALQSISSSTNLPGRYRDLQTLKAAYEAYGKLHPEHNFPTITLPPPPPKPVPYNLKGKLFSPDDPEPVAKPSTSWGKHGKPSGKSSLWQPGMKFAGEDGPPPPGFKPAAISPGQQNFLAAQKAKAAKKAPTILSPETEAKIAAIKKAKESKKRSAAVLSEDLQFRNWTKWHEEHPYVPHPRRKDETASEYDQRLKTEYSAWIKSGGARKAGDLIPGDRLHYGNEDHMVMAVHKAPNGKLAISLKGEASGKERTVEAGRTANVQHAHADVSPNESKPTSDEKKTPSKARTDKMFKPKDALAKAQAAADAIPEDQRGEAFTEHRKMTDDEYQKHRQHVEYETTRHGANDLMNSPFSTHNSEDRVNGAEGAYTPARQKQQQAIIDDIMKKAESVPDDHQAIIMGGPGGAGKMVPLDSPVPTPTGWTTIGEIAESDVIFGADGNLTTVLALSPIDQMPVSYRITFDDGTVQDACADHQWLTFDVKEREALRARTPEWRAKRRASRPSRASSEPKFAQRGTGGIPPTKDAPTGTVRTTKELAGSVLDYRGAVNHGVPMAGALQMPEADLPIHPYVLGAWLGDGDSAGARLTSADPEIAEQIRAVGEPCRKMGRPYQWSLSDGLKTGPHGTSLHARLGALGVRGNKHLPPTYLRASAEQRLALLQGLMDTDGTVDKRSGRVSFTTTSPALRDGVEELVLSLGWKVQARESRAKIDGRDCGPKWNLCFSPTTTVFRLNRKAKHQTMPTTIRTRFRLIVSVEEIAPVPMRCLTVDNERGLFLIGRRFLVTHNSTILRKSAADPDSTASKLGIKYAHYAEADDPENHIHKGDGIGDPVNYVTLNPDDIKGEMVKRGMVPTVDHLSPMEAAGPFAHEEASQIVQRVADRLTAQGKNVIWDITLNSEKSGVTRVDALRHTPGGYHIAGAFVDVKLDSSDANARARHRHGQDDLNLGKPGATGGRFVPSGVISAQTDKEGKYRSANRAAFEKLKAKGTFDHTLTYDNEGYAGKLLDESGKSLATRADTDEMPHESDITTQIKAYRAGEMDLPALTKRLANRTYASPSYFSDGDLNMDDLEDVDRSEPGTWNEVTHANDTGLLSDADYAHIHAAMCAVHGVPA